jgi:hypothetical protein
MKCKEIIHEFNLLRTQSKMANLKIKLGLAITVAVSDVADVFIPCSFSFISI